MSCAASASSSLPSSSPTASAWYPRVLDVQPLVLAAEGMNPGFGPLTGKMLGMLCSAQ